jgi:hypothetical protein
MLLTMFLRTNDRETFLFCRRIITLSILLLTTILIGRDIPLVPTLRQMMMIFSAFLVLVM